MAVARCGNHGKPDGRKHNYVQAAKPIGYPDKTSTICGLKDCEDPGLIWLDEVEAREYERGKRVFEMFTYAVKVRVQ